ncbi:MAG: WGR domain-containing protein [Campylobacterales bacterium]|nr:WGR domain-containing protein [Campylobacterales bacterium]
MTRAVNARERYYTVELFPNLFGEWLLVRTYGSLKKLKPTGVIRQIYESADEAMEYLITFIQAKKKKGYSQSTQINKSYTEIIFFSLQHIVCKKLHKNIN